VSNIEFCNIVPVGHLNLSSILLLEASVPVTRWHSVSTTSSRTSHPVTQRFNYIVPYQSPGDTASQLHRRVPVTRW